MAPVIANATTTHTPYPWEVPQVPHILGGDDPDDPTQGDWFDPTLRPQRPSRLTPEQKARKRLLKQRKAMRLEAQYLAELAVNAEVAVTLVGYHLPEGNPEARRVLDEALALLASLHP